MSSKEKYKLLDGLCKQLDILLEKRLDVLFAERPFLENPSPSPVILETEETRREYEQTSLEINETAKAIGRLMGAEMATIISPAKQSLVQGDLI